MIGEIETLVSEILEKNQEGHGMDHIKRVLNLALKFADLEHGEKELVTLIALLHDVDDYKLFGSDNARNLTNTKRILKEGNVPENIQEKVLSSIQTIGYKKRLYGIVPEILEAKIVSDADMCDGMGAHVILRTYDYQNSHHTPFFDASIFPTENINKDNYKLCADTAVCHFFEKILRLERYMLTNSGKEEARKRNQILIDFLFQYFEEENAFVWIEYLKGFLKK